MSTYLYTRFARCDGNISIKPNAYRHNGTHDREIRCELSRIQEYYIIMGFNAASKNNNR